MKHSLLVLVLVIGLFVHAQTGFSATYDANGTWYFTSSNSSHSCPAGGLGPVKSGTMVICQARGYFSLDYAGQFTIGGPVEEATYEGLDDFSVFDGTTTVTFSLTLTSESVASGHISWIWTDGVDTCGGGFDISATTEPPPPENPTSVSGKVLVSSIAGYSDLPVINAMVALQGTGYSTETNIEGSVTIEAIVPDAYTLTITSAGLVPLSQQIALSQDEQLDLGVLNMTVLTQDDIDQAVQQALENCDGIGDQDRGLDDVIRWLQILTGTRN